ncbi:MAG: phosphatase PAP2 family protein, partial [Synergistaceae bacterium]|nr:phosphatase PAP2 family protein [Synergistaceae bacterium]
MISLSALPALLSSHAPLAYGAVFLTALGESLAGVGLLVPGTVLMFGFGAVVAMGGLEFWTVFFVAAAGAMGGDGISYWLGRKYRAPLAVMWPFSRHPGILERGEDFFLRHGGKSVFLGRFVGPIRPVIPLVAGMMGMKPLQFTVVNVTSGFGWAGAYLVPGMIFGTSLQVAGAVSSRLALLLLLLLVLLWSALWIGKKIFRTVSSAAPALFKRLKGWSLKRESRWRGELFLKKAVFLLLFRKSGEEIFYALLILFFFTATWTFFKVTGAVLSQDPLVLIDQGVNNLFQSLRTPWADRFFVAVTELGGSFVNITLSAALLLLFMTSRCTRAGAFWAIAALGGIALVQLLKIVLLLPRPIEVYRGVSLYSFPSGHTTMAVVIYGFLALLLSRGRPPFVRGALFLGAFLISGLIAASRLYLGVHWLSDVLGGFLLGSAWIALLGLLYLERPCEGLPGRKTLGVALLALLLAGGWQISRRLELDMPLYAPRQEERILALSDWTEGEWRSFPARRIDLEGEKGQPLVLQAGVSPSILRQLFLDSGWRPSPSMNGKTLLSTLSPATAMEDLPLLPRLHNGRSDDIRLLRRVSSDERLLLRLWPSGANTPSGHSFFEGTLE